MHLNRLTQPAAELLTLAAAKTHLRLDAGLTDDDAYIQTLITVAREYCEDFTRRGLGVCDYELILDNFPADRNYIELPVIPIQSVASIKYTDAANNVVTMDPANYIADVDRMPGAVFLPFARIWPCAVLQSGAAVRIKFTAGHDSSNVPQRLLQAALLLIGHWYNNREQVVDSKYSIEIPMGIRALLQPLKVW